MITPERKKEVIAQYATQKDELELSLYCEYEKGWQRGGLANVKRLYGYCERQTDASRARRVRPHVWA